jgi:hypothetical protein
VRWSAVNVFTKMRFFLIIIALSLECCGPSGPLIVTGPGASQETLNALFDEMSSGVPVEGTGITIYLSDAKLAFHGKRYAGFLGGFHEHWRRPSGEWDSANQTLVPRGRFEISTASGTYVGKFSTGPGVLLWSIYTDCGEYFHLCYLHKKEAGRKFYACDELYLDMETWSIHSADVPALHKN